MPNCPQLELYRKTERQTYRHIHAGRGGHTSRLCLIERETQAEREKDADRGGYTARKTGECIDV